MLTNHKGHCTSFDYKFVEAISTVITAQWCYKMKKEKLNT